jgi:hypothetical protein
MAQLPRMTAMDGFRRSDRGAAKRYPIGGAKHGVRLFVFVAVHRKQAPEADSILIAGAAMPSTSRIRPSRGFGRKIEEVVGAV